jgi:hypothetical protein
MSLDDDAARLEIHAAIATMVGGIPEKDTCDLAMRQLMRHSGSNVRITQETKGA